MSISTKITRSHWLQNLKRNGQQQHRRAKYNASPILPFSTNNSVTENNATSNRLAAPNFGQMVRGTWERYSLGGQQKRIRIAERLFRAAQWRAMNPGWYGEHKIPVSFRPQHAMLSMHIWFLHKRLIVDSQATTTTTSTSANPSTTNLLLDEELFDVFWNDTQSRIRAVEGIHELTLNKHLKDAQQATFLQCTQYDHAFLDHPDDPKGRLEVICDGVWKHVLGGGDNVGEELIKRLGAYVAYQAENVISRLPEEYFIEGRVNWGSMPDLDHESVVNSGGYVAGDGVNNEIVEARGRGLEFVDGEDGDWIIVLTDAGKPYYWNRKTNETFWERPS